MAHTKIIDNQKKSKQRYDANRKDETYDIGDFVYLKQQGLNH